jgi:predicted lipoprotein with Yx(FWY)xxD motif
MSVERARQGDRLRSGKILRRVGIGAVVASVAFGTLLFDASAATPPFLQSTNIKAYSGVLANATGRTLYVLSTEKNTTVHCVRHCLTTWPPLLVKSSTKSVSLGAGVSGKIGFVKRSSTKKQVTFNSYPVYAYSGDSGAKQSNGEGISADGGTWTMVHASAKTASGTPFARIRPTLQSINTYYYAGVLATSSAHSLYLLSTEKGGTINCSGGCTSTWIPLEVTSNTKPVSTGPNVDGTIGFVSRGTSIYEVTFNSYPVYRYKGDSGATTTAGEGRVAYGGTWYLLSASATTAATTPVPPY